MTRDIRIRRCAIAIERKDGAAAWATEADHRRLAKRVQALVLASLDQWLPALVEANGLDRVTIPEIDLQLALTHADLCGAAPLARPELRGKIAQALAAARVAPLRVAQSGSDPLPATTVGFRDLSSKPVDPTTLSRAIQSALDLLVERYRQGNLLFELALLPEANLLALARRILVETGQLPPAAATIKTKLPTAPPPAVGQPQGIARRLRAALAALALARTLSGEPPQVGQIDPASQAALQTLARSLAAAQLALAPSPGQTKPKAQETASPPTVPAAAEQAGTSPRPSKGQEPKVGDHPSASPGTVTETRFAVPSLLPYLLLQPLGRHAVWSGLAEDTARLAPLAAMFATMTLGASPGVALPESELQRAAARFANRAESVRGAELQRDATTLTEAAAMLVARCGALLLAGHNEARPLLAISGGAQPVIAEREGLAPLAVLDPERLAAFAETCRTPVLAADRHLAQQLADAGLDTICPGAPGRGEVWSAVRGPAGWIGTTGMDLHRAAQWVRWAPWAEAGIERAQKVWAALSSARLPIPPGALAALRGDLAVVLGFALAELGLALERHDCAAWSDPDPLLVLERFGTLGGEIELGLERVTVRVPMGRRFFDLRRAGLLATVTAPPWWPGRSLEFVGG